MDPATFERLHPCRFVTFTIPNPQSPADGTNNGYGDPLRVAVLDSADPATVSVTAAMLVPKHREDDWIFSSHHGHLQLLLSSSSSVGQEVSRLVLVGDTPSPEDPSSLRRIYTRLESDHRATVALEQRLYPLLLALSPRSAFETGLPNVPFLSYEDGIIRGVVVERAVGPVAGEMLVEDVVVVVIEETNNNNVSPAPPPRAEEVRRRLRFKRLPNLVQTQIRMVPPELDDGVGIPSLETGVLVQPYLAPMVAGLSLICPFLEEQRRRPRVLCLGVGGGALLTFLHSRLGFDVLGVEADDVVLGIASRHFGLRESKFLRVLAGDGIKFLIEARNDCAESAARHYWQQHHSIDAIMVDLDSSDATSGASAPPPEFLAKNVLLGARSVLRQQAVLVVNVVPLSGSFYNRLIDALHEVFSELYEIDVDGTENYVLVATTSPINLEPASVRDGFLFNKFKEVVGERYVVNHMRKI